MCMWGMYCNFMKQCNGVTAVGAVVFYGISWKGVIDVIFLYKL